MSVLTANATHLQAGALPQQPAPCSPQSMALCSLQLIAVAGSNAGWVPCTAVTMCYAALPRTQPSSVPPHTQASTLLIPSVHILLVHLQVRGSSSGPHGVASVTIEIVAICRADPTPARLPPSTHRLLPAGPAEQQVDHGQMAYFPRNVQWRLALEVGCAQGATCEQVLHRLGMAHT